MRSDILTRAEIWMAASADNRSDAGMAEMKNIVDELLNSYSELARRSRQRGRRLAESEKKYRRLVENTMDIPYSLDTSGRILYVGPQAKKYGYDPADLEGHSFDEVIFPADRDRIAAEFQEALTQGRTIRSQFRIQPPDGKLYWFEELGALERNAKGEILRLTGILRDVTGRKQTEDALRQSEANLMRAQEVAHIGSWYMDIKRDSLQWCAETYRMFGAVPDAPLNYDFVISKVHPEDRDLVEVQWNAALQGAPYDIEHRIVVDGSVKWVRERAEIDFDEQGQPVSAIGTVQDITERKRIEAAEREAFDRLSAFESAVNQGPAVIFRWRIDPNDWPVEMVSANVRQFGYTPENFASGKVRWPDITHPEDLPRLEDEVRGFLEQDVTQFSQHYRIITKTGDIRWIEDRNVVVKDSDGTPSHIQGVVMDVTQQKYDEQKRREAEERYRRLFETESDAILIFDKETRRFVDVNKAASRLYGYTHDEFLGLKLDDISTDPKAADESIARVVMGFEGLIPLRWHRKKDGTVFPVEISPSRFTIEGREVLCGIHRDISDRISAEKKLRSLSARLVSAQDEEQRRIAEGLHDDVAQVLTASKMNVALAAEAENPEEAQVFNERALQLLSTAIAKVRSLSFELASSTLYRVGFHEAIRELCDGMSERYAIHCRLEVDYHEDPLDDSTATVVFKAVRELLFNVVKHAGTQEATVSVCEETGMLLVTVEDHGKGFASASPNGDISAGNGLGLFGIKERLKDLGGDLKIDSEPGRGTRAILRVPIHGESRAFR